MLGTETVHRENKSKDDFQLVHIVIDEREVAALFTLAVFFSDRIFTGVVLSVPHIASGTLHHTGRGPGPPEQPGHLTDDQPPAWHSQHVLSLRGFILFN